jgi:methyltransferase (TIGR00027 family)
VTARWVAAERARLARTRPSTPGGEPEAEVSFDRDVRGLVAVPFGSRRRLEERTRFVDSEVARAIGHGLTQVVLLGAGYDARSLRFGGGAARWFEVDRPETQVDKRRRLSSLGADLNRVTYVGADLTTDDVGTSLGAAGHDARLPSLFVGEGLFEHLTLETAVNLCTSLRTRAPEGSILAATFVVVPEERTGAFAVLDALDRLRQTVGAPRRSEYREGDAEKLVFVTGWRVVRTSSPPRSGRGSSLLALACEPSPPATAT